MVTYSRIKKARSGLGDFLFHSIEGFEVFNTTYRPIVLVDSVYSVDNSFDCDFFYDRSKNIQFTLVKFNSRAQGPPGGSN